MTEKNREIAYRIVTVDRDRHVPLRCAVQRVWEGTASPDDYSVEIRAFVPQPGTHLSHRASGVLDPSL